MCPLIEDVCSPRILRAANAEDSFTLGVVLIQEKLPIHFSDAPRVPMVPTDAVSCTARLELLKES